MTLSPPLGILADCLVKGRLVPFLGAGASLSEQSTSASTESGSLPTAQGLADLLYERLGLPTSGSGASGMSLLDVSTFYELYVGRNMLQEELRSIFLSVYKPTSLHQFLADLSYPVFIMTSNYDTLLEQAFQCTEKPYHLLVTPVARPDLKDRMLWWQPGSEKPLIIRPKEFELSLETTSIIFKIHGSVDPKSSEFDSFIVTEEDYFEMAGRFFLKTLIPDCIHRHLVRCNFLFLGYGLRDIHVRHTLKQLGLHFKHFAIVKNVSPVDLRMWQRLDIDAYQMLISDFVESFRERCKTIGAITI
jgi:hypothetical protein